MAEEQEVEVAEATTEKKETKSIVPAKYAGRYKAGGSDALAAFIKRELQGQGRIRVPGILRAMQEERDR